MRTCVCGRGGGAARLAASVVGCVLCMCGAARHPCVEDMQRGVVAWCGCAFADFLYACYNMYNTNCKEFSHTAIISRTCSHLSGTDSATRGLQAARQLRSKSHSFRRETRRAGRFVMLATVRGHAVSERNDEKVPIFQRRPFILWDESPSPPRSVFAWGAIRDFPDHTPYVTVVTVGNGVGNGVVMVGNGRTAPPSR